MDQILNYFPDLDDKQRAQFQQLIYLYQFWNDKVNLISRNDLENFYERHVLHSLAIAKFIEFEKGSVLMDLGTGGGFPGIPLAILFPDCEFLLVDSIEKKIRVVDIIYKNLALQNVKVLRSRVEDIQGEFDFILSRAVADLSKLVKWSAHLIKRRSINDYPNGLICLKGGDLNDETAPFRDIIYQFPLNDYFKGDFFRDKYVVYLPVD